MAQEILFLIHSSNFRSHNQKCIYAIRTGLFWAAIPSSGLAPCQKITFQQEVNFISGRILTGVVKSSNFQQLEIPTVGTSILLNLEHSIIEE